MTAYQGGKKRLGKRISKVIQAVENDLVENKLDYFEPFVGMGGVLKHMCSEPRSSQPRSSQPRSSKNYYSDRKIIASDINKDLILMWKALQKGWKPPKTCSEKKYIELKYSTKHSPERGYIGVVASWGGMFFHAYRLKYAKGDKNFMDEGYRAIMKMVPIVENVKFLSGSYDEYLPENMLIYCDPPYKGNKLGDKNSLFQNFNHDEFWETMRNWSKKNIVIISESSAPKDFKKIWSAKSTVLIKIKKSGSTKKSYKSPVKQKKYIDNLYIHKNLYKQLSKRVKLDIKLI
jgi:site-specific DNA-adenine methylase